MISQAEPVYVFDLDGTVIDVNSFPWWVRFMLAGGPPEGRLRTRAAMAMATAAALAERKIGRRSHRVLKGRLQRIWARHAGPSGAERFAQSLVPRLAPALLPLVGMARSGRIDAILATAAVEEYALPLSRILGFAHVCATPQRAAEIGENVGPAKRRAVEATLERLGWSGRPLVVFTDHVEDRPLIELADRLVWCGGAEDARLIANELPHLAQISASVSGADAVARFALEGLDA